MKLCITCHASWTSAPDGHCEPCFLDRVRRRKERAAPPRELHHSCDPIAVQAQRQVAAHA